MTIPNAVAAFRMTGIFPFNRAALKTVDTGTSCKQTTGLHFLPALSPAPVRSAAVACDNLLVNDIPPVQSIISMFLPDSRARPQIHLPQFYEKTCGKVLKGAEYRKEVEEKEKLKRDKEQLAKEKKKKREEKKSVKKPNKPAKTTSSSALCNKSSAKGKILIFIVCLFSL